MVSGIFGEVHVEKFWDVVIEPASSHLDLSFSCDYNDFTGCFSLFNLCAPRHMEDEVSKCDVFFVLLIITLIIVSRVASSIPSMGMDVLAMRNWLLLRIMLR